MPAVLLDRKTDPAEEILSLTGDLNDIDVFNRHVLVAVYERNKGDQEVRTESGLWMPQTSPLADDKNQSKVGMILKMGVRAFFDPDEKWFQGQDMVPGDWVFFRAHNGWRITLISRDKNGRMQELLCRMIEDTEVVGRVSGELGPDRIY